MLRRNRMFRTSSSTINPAELSSSLAGTISWIESDPSSELFLVSNLSWGGLVSDLRYVVIFVWHWLLAGARGKSEGMWDVRNVINYAWIYSPMSGGGVSSRNICFALLKPLRKVAVGIVENCIANASFAFAGLSSVETLLVANSSYNSLMNGEFFASKTLAGFSVLGVGVMATIINFLQQVFMFDDQAIRQGLQSVVWKSRQSSNISHRPVLRELVRASWQLLCLRRGSILS